MAKANETMADIIAEMRRREKSHYYPKVARNIMHQYSDRIDAAWKREKAEWESAACACVSDAVMSGRVAVEHPPFGNAAAMREALLRIVEFAKAWADPGADAATTLGLIIDKAESALSSPPRQCDIGSAEEQVARYHAFCYRMMKQNNHCCGPCPCHKFVNGEAQSCTLIWAQMPYEAEEGGAK